MFPRLRKVRKLLLTYFCSFQVNGFFTVGDVFFCLVLLVIVASKDHVIKMQPLIDSNSSSMVKSLVGKKKFFHLFLRCLPL